MKEEYMNAENWARVRINDFLMWLYRDSYSNPLHILGFDDNVMSFKGKKMTIGEVQSTHTDMVFTTPKGRDIFIDIKGSFCKNALYIDFEVARRLKQGNDWGELKIGWATDMSTMLPLEDQYIIHSFENYTIITPKMKFNEALSILRQEQPRFNKLSSYREKEDEGRDSDKIPKLNYLLEVSLIPNEYNQTLSLEDSHKFLRNCESRIYYGNMNSGYMEVTKQLLYKNSL